MSGRLPPAVGWRPARRTSFSRRDSNLALIGAMLAGVVVAAGVMLLLLSRINPDQGTRLRGAAADLLRPVHAVVMAPVQLLGAAADAIGDHWQAVHDVRALESELESARKSAAQAEQLAVSLAQLERLVDMQRPERRVVATAAASVAPASAGSRMAIIGAGHHHGVRPRMPVIGPDGLVGRTIDVGLGAARVVLITDPNSRVPVTILRNGWSGIAMGLGTHVMEFQFDPQSGDDRVRNGDRLVTSGDGGLFPPGIPVGTIIDAGRPRPQVRPAVSPAAIGIVMVEAPWLAPPAIVAAPAAEPEADRLPVRQLPDAPAEATVAPVSRAAGQ